MGSSKLIEYFIALFVGLLAILAGLFVIGFLLVDPLREPNGIDDTAPLRGGKRLCCEGCVYSLECESAPRN